MKFLHKGNWEKVVHSVLLPLLALLACSSLVNCARLSVFSANYPSSWLLSVTSLPWIFLFVSLPFSVLEFPVTLITSVLPMCSANHYICFIIIFITGSVHCYNKRRKSYKGMTVNTI